MSDGINIEVIGKYKERYPAKIQSFSGENELIIKFTDNPDILCKVPINNVLLLLDNNNETKSQDFQVGCNVLALQKFDDSSTPTLPFNDIKLPQAYWPARIEKLKGCFAAIQLTNKDNEIYNDIVELSTLRSMNDSRPLLKNDIHNHEMIVPDDLSEFCEHYDIRGDLIRWCGSAIVVNFDKINRKLQIFSTEQEVVRKASLLDASFMRLLRQKKLVHNQKDELTKRLNESVKSQFTEEFTVCDSLMGLAIGHLGCNIKKAREIEGVINIDLNDQTHTFVISAQTPEACKAARAQLEYSQEILYVPMDIVAKVIGKGGNNIQDIINQSGINRVKVVEGPDLMNWIDEDNKNMLVDHVPFIFFGSAGKVIDAKLLLEFSIENHREMDQLQKERDEIQREIRNSQMSSGLPGRLTNSYMDMDRDDDIYDNYPPFGRGGYNSGGGNRGRNNYKHMSGSNNDQRNDSYNDDQMPPSQQKFRGNGRQESFRRGNGGFRQGPLPQVNNGQQNGNRRYQQYDDDTEDYTPVPVKDSENGRPGIHQNSNPRYRGSGGKFRQGRGGRANNHNNNGSQGRSQKSTSLPGPSDHQRNGSGNAEHTEQQQQHSHPVVVAATVDARESPVNDRVNSSGSH